MAHQFSIDQLMAGVADLTYADLSGLQVNNKEFSFVDFSHANLSKAKLQGTVFKNCKFNGANLKGANLQNTIFQGCTMQGTGLENSKGIADFIGCNMMYANLSNSKLDGSTFLKSLLTSANLQKASLINSTLISSSLIEASLDSASLQRATIRKCDFRDAEFMNTDMSAITASENKNITFKQYENFKLKKDAGKETIGKYLVSYSHPNVYMINKYIPSKQSVEIINVETMKKYRRKLRVAGSLYFIYVKDKLGNEYRIVDKRPKSVPYI